MADSLTDPVPRKMAAITIEHTIRDSCVMGSALSLQLLSAPQRELYPAVSLKYHQIRLRDAICLGRDFILHERIAQTIPAQIRRDKAIIVITEPAQPMQPSPELWFPPPLMAWLSVIAVHSA